MNIIIITQPLLCNYGGLLQNFAMQKILEGMGHKVESVDYLKLPLFSSFFSYICSWIKTLVLLFTPKRRPFIKYTHKGFRSLISQEFVKKHLKLTKSCYNYSKRMLKKYDVVIVGSDQVWRPKYNYSIEDMYLKFAKGLSVKRIAFAASFGVDNWEYDFKQTRECSKLAKKFDAISVRENTGVNLCKKYLGVEAAWVLDPTLLLAKEDYLSICNEIPVCNEKYLAVYVLDENPEVIKTYEKEADMHKLVVKKFYAGPKSNLTVPEWIAMFRDASYVVTDSFHGTVFSIIFQKNFKCVYNKMRGSTRFESLLDLYNSDRLDEMRGFSLNWLKNALES